LNLYTYVENNPLKYIDPSGHAGKFHYDYGGSGGGCSCTPTNIGDTVYAIAEFLIIDDIRTVLDPNASFFDKTLAAAGFFPIGKLIKGGKIIKKLSNGTKDIERAVDYTEDAGKQRIKYLVIALLQELRYLQTKGRKISKP